MTHKPVLSLPTLKHCYLLLVFNHLYRHHYTHSVLMTKNGDITGTSWRWTGLMGSVVQTGPILKGSSSCGRVKKIINIKLYHTLLHINNINIKTDGGHANTDHDPRLVLSCWWWWCHLNRTHLKPLPLMRSHMGSHHWHQNTPPLSPPPRAHDGCDDSERESSVSRSKGYSRLITVDAHKLATQDYLNSMLCLSWAGEGRQWFGENLSDWFLLYYNNKFGLHLFFSRWMLQTHFSFWSGRIGNHHYTIFPNSKTIISVNSQWNFLTVFHMQPHRHECTVVHTWSGRTVQKDSSVESEDKESEWTLVRRDCMSSYTQTRARMAMQDTRRGDNGQNVMQSLAFMKHRCN